jgi:hypothetical protein
MEMDTVTQNAACLERELGWLEQVVGARFRQYFATGAETGAAALPEAPDLSADASV